MKSYLFRSAAAVLTAALLLGAASFAEGPRFADVPEDEWYYSDVETAVASGIINGKTEDSYAPDDFLTIAEAVKLASCMNETNKNGSVSLVPGDPWYEPYAVYALENGIIGEDEEFDWDKNATRAEFAGIFAKALPESELQQKNTVDDGAIPDVGDIPQADAIYALYRAGVLTGSDARHSFLPDDPIKRSEVAAIITRMMDAEARIDLTLTTAGDTVRAADFIGSYGDETSQRASMMIYPGEYPAYRVEIRWGSSYDSAGVWIMNAVFSEENCSLEYTGGEMAEETYNEDGTVNLREVQWDDAEGRFYFGEDGVLLWEDSREDRSADMRFNRYEYEPIDPDVLVKDYFMVIGGFLPDESGSSLKRAEAARDAVRFACENNIWTRDIGELRESLLTAWDSMSDEEKAAFDENFIDILTLVNTAGGDYDSVKGVFSDAGAEDILDLLASDTGMLSWSVLSSNTLTLGNSDGE